MENIYLVMEAHILNNDKKYTVIAASFNEEYCNELAEHLSKVESDEYTYWVTSAPVMETAEELIELSDTLY